MSHFPQKKMKLLLVSKNKFLKCLKNSPLYHLEMALEQYDTTFSQHFMVGMA